MTSGHGSLHVTGDGAVVNFGTITGSVHTGRTVVLPPEAVRSAAETFAAGEVSLIGSTEQFTGRGEELAALREALSEDRGPGNVAAAVVHGLGGVGKSALAARYAQLNREAYDLVWWIDAAVPGSIEAALADIARRLSPVWAGTAEPPELTAWAMAWLQRHGRWLLVYDNVEDPRPLRLHLSSLGRGHHLITSRKSDGWREVRTRMPLDVLPREAAVDLLLSYVPDRTASPELRWEATELAVELGCLPLALHQAGAYIAETETGFTTYRRRLGHQLDKPAEEGDRERTIARIWSLTLAAVTERDPPAAELLYSLAWLDPDDCPRTLLTRLAPGEVEADDALRVLRAFSMITLTERSVRVHRLVQSVLRADAAATAAAAAPPAPSPRGRSEAEQALVGAVFPEGPSTAADPAQLARLARHACALAATNPPGAYRPEVSRLYARACVYLNDEGLIVQALPLYEAYDAQIAHGFATDHPFRLVSRLALAGAYEAVGNPARAVGLLEPLVAAALRVHGPGHVTTLNVRGGLASAYQALGNVGRAIDEYERAVEASREGLGEGHLRTLTLRNNLAGAYESVGLFDRAIEVYEDLLSQEDALARWEHPTHSLRLNGLRVRNNLAGAYESVGRYEEAVSLYRTTLADLERTSGPEHPDTLSCLGNLGYTLESGGRIAEARVIYHDVLERREKALGEAHPDTLLSRSNLAYHYVTTGDFGRGLDLCRLTLAQREQVLGPEHPDTLVSRNMLASAFEAAGEPERAVPLFRATLAQRERVLGPEHPATLRVLGSLAGCLLRLGNAAEAVPLLDAALTAQERLFGPESHDAVLSRNNLAAACREAGDLERAFALITTAVEQRTRLLGENHPDTLASRSNLARLYEAMGDLGEALPRYESAFGQLTAVLGADHPMTVTVGGHLSRARRKSGGGNAAP
ncbi:tetratricopeptide repeat protein [Kitasatospora sp. NBC_00458]